MGVGPKKNLSSESCNRDKNSRLKPGVRAISLKPRRGDL